jgi:hypothetical protein
MPGRSWATGGSGEARKQKLENRKSQNPHTQTRRVGHPPFNGEQKWRRRFLPPGFRGDQVVGAVVDDELAEVLSAVLDGGAVTRRPKTATFFSVAL